MPRTAKPYRLVPTDVPPSAGKGAGLYAEIVADFVASGIESALVELPGRRPNSLNVGLRKAVATTGAGVKVITRAGQVYLQRV